MKATLWLALAPALFVLSVFCLFQGFIGSVNFTAGTGVNILSFTITGEGTGGWTVGGFAMLLAAVITYVIGLIRMGVSARERV